MFSALFKSRKSEQLSLEEEAKNLFTHALTQIRKPEFFTKGGVPDSFDGRFDLLILHLFLIINALMDRPESKNLSQALFDITFRNTDQTLREMGVGDMGIPKHMRRMMKAFNGRMHAYRDALINDNGTPNVAFKEALRRNLYGTITTQQAEAIDFINNYVNSNIKSLQILPQSNISFAQFEET